MKCNKPHSTLMLIVCMLPVLLFLLLGLPPLNNTTSLTPARTAVGWVAYLLLFAILTPLPHRLYEALATHCPYL